MADERFREHLRLTVLRLLAGAPCYRANSSIIHQVVNDFGFAATRDQVRAELAWLVEQGLVATQDLQGLIVATMTERGCDVAEGRAITPGVQRPTPKG